MGVRGLATLLDSHPRIYRDVRFRRSRLIIDGCNLLYDLYIESGLDQNSGGDYGAFEKLIQNFVGALRACEVTAYVVLDGGSDPSDKKLETMTLRAKKRIKRAHEAAVSGCRRCIAPLLVEAVFRQTLVRLEVPVAKCFGEADREIAALASEWQSPVLSNDSDFYIFDLPGGLLPISHFQWRKVEALGSRRYIPCKKYNTSSFCIFFSLQRQLLPALAALAGNDYVRVCQSVSWAQFSVGGGSRLEGLVAWLKSFQQPEEALEAALGLLRVELSGEQRAQMLQELHKGMEEYELGPSVLKKFFIHGAAPPRPAGAEVVPDWVQLPLTRGRMPATALDVLQLHRNNLSNPVENADLPSSQLTSRPLRQVMYGILLGPGSPVQVQERDREGLELSFIPVQPKFTAASRDLPLKTLDKAALSQRLQVLLEALNVTETSLLNLDPELRLPVAVTCYWQQRTGPDEALLKSLVLSLSSGDVLRNRGVTRERRRVQVPLEAAHALNQWQACLRDGVYLNQVLGFPLPEPHIARLYEGTLVHQLVHQARTGKLRTLYLAPRRRTLYKSTLAVVQQCGAQTAVVVTVTAPVVTVGELRRLFIECEEEEEDESATAALEDLDLEDLVSVRTRLRAKNRMNRCNTPELLRKEERRGLL